MQRKLTLTCLFIILFSLGVFAQITIRGTVTSSGDQEPLPGVSVVVKGTTIGTVTDVDGNYSLTNIPTNATLVFSFIGFMTIEEIVDNRRTIDVILTESIQIIDEVVVMGYTTRKRSQISSSIASVSADQLNDITSKSVSTLLQGKVGGVFVENTSGNPNTTSNITIRGNSSYTAGSSPLTVVDGIIGGTANPNDIKSITILKDAAATALYGARAANGVIIIETHSGSASTTQVTLNVIEGASFVNFGPVELMNSTELWEFQKTYVPEDIFARERPEWLKETNTDWTKLAYRTAHMRDYLLSVSGGSDKTQFYVSGNYYYEEGVMRHVYNSFVNIRSNVTHKITDKLQLAVRLNLRDRNFSNEASGNYGATRARSYMPWDSPYLPDGSLKTGMEGEPIWTYQYNYNFLHEWQYNHDIGKRQEMVSDITLTYKILPNLTLSTHNRGSYSNSKSELYYDPRSVAGRGEGELWIGMRYNNTLLTSNRLNYDLQFDKHLLNMLAVYEWEQSHRERNNQVGIGFEPGIHVMDAAAEIRRTGNERGDEAMLTPGEQSDTKWQKYLVQADYIYDDRYFLVASYIREGSSRFGDQVRFANFYTLGASWILTNEAFMKNQNFFDSLKLRISSGSIGNANIGDYQWQQLLSAVSFNSQSALVPNRMGNSDLTWEKISITNLGLDFAIFKRRLNFNIDLYDKTSNALLFNVPKPITEGFPNRMENVGSFRNRGIEVGINSVNIQTSSFRWETFFNIAHNKNKVLKLFGGQEITTGDYRLKEGQDRYMHYMRRWMGVDPADGMPTWEKIEEDGTKTIVKNWNDATLQYVGSSAAPKATGGLSNDLFYKNFSLRILFNFTIGNTIRYLTPSNGVGMNTNYAKMPKGDTRWEKPGDIADHPKAVWTNNNAGSASNRAYGDGSFLRLRTIQLGYNLPKGFLNQIKITNGRVYISGDYLWVFTKYNGMDPETNLSGNISGLDGINYEYGSNFQQDSFGMPRKVTFGINLTF